MGILKWIFKKIISVIKFIGKQVAIFVFRTFLFCLLVFGGIYWLYSASQGEINKKSDRAYEYVEIDLSGEYKEGAKNIIDIIKGDNINYYGLLKSIEKAKEDPKVKGIIFKLDGFTLNSAQSEEIAKKVEELKKEEKKVVYAYATSLTKKSYEFATSASEIIMPDTASSTNELTGYSVEIPFYKRLADKIGVSFAVVHMGDYKSFGENLSSTTMSSYSRENMTNLLDKFYNRFVEKVALKREVSKDTLNKEILSGELAIITPKELKEKKLIDKTMHYYDLKEELGSDKIISLSEYSEISTMKKLATNASKSKNTSIVATNTKKPSIGVITLRGNVLDDLSDESEAGITPEIAESQIRMAMEDENIKGVVVRIDSPGGSALSSELIYHMLMESKKKYKKPVYISMGGVAASGGYYIASAGDKIFANASTITGSIGVVSIIPNIEELSGKVGVDIEVISNGKNGDLYSVFKKVDKDKVRVILKSNARVYDEFKSRVASSRKMSMEDVEKIARGRVWTGEEAKANGLVDENATLLEVVDIMAKDLGFESGAYNTFEISDEDIKSGMKGYLKILKQSSLGAKMDLQEVYKILFSATLGDSNLIQNNLNKPLMYWDVKID